MQQLIELDGNALLWIQDNIRNEYLTPVFKFITALGNGGILWIAIALMLLIPKKTRKVGIIAIVSIALSAIVDNVILKNVIARTRPYEVVDGLSRLIEKQKDYSFPSGHTGSSFAVAVVLLIGLPKKYGIPAIILAFLIGISRLYVGVHYPTDVLCGALIGTIIAIFSYWFVTKIFTHNKKDVIQ